ncbi:MAG TPA: hypothetical protein ENG62_03130 [Thermoplasmatales archaeon]|nr:hypothetical protein [Thermoplasmatales archaeon]
MDKPTKILLTGLILGATLFIGLQLLNFLNYGIHALNFFFSFIGLIIFLLSGFFFVSMKTAKW